MSRIKLSSEWEKSGIEPGETVLVHSDIKRTVRRYLREGVRLTTDDILDSLLDAVGPQGTLLFPLFNFDFTKGITFDVNKTPSQMGSLTEAARNHTDAVRTGHPIYSFAVIGDKVNIFEDVDNVSGYGHDSPFAILRELDGKIGVLDLPDQNSMTFYHHVEEMHDVEYRYHKKFTSAYVDKKGDCENRTYSLFVRDIEKGVLTHVNPAGEMMWKSGIYNGSRPKEGSGLRTAKANEVYEFASKIIKSGNAEGVLFKYEGGS